MKTPRLITRRRAIAAGLASAGGLLLARNVPADLPPMSGNVLRMGDALTYAAHRALLPGQSLVKEYRISDLTPFPATGTTNPGARDSALGEAYRAVRSNDFADWRLSVEGSVASPRAFSLAELKGLAARTQITRHTCEEGWTAIGQWTGVPLNVVLDAVGVLPAARFVMFYSYDDWVDCIDMLDALHPQTLLTYGMNGRDLLIQHGAPLRLRVERQLGYKSMKYLHRIVVTDKFDDGGIRGHIHSGWAWYVGI